MSEPIKDQFGWRNSHKDPPAAGQEIYYFGPNIGIGVGRYHYEEQRIISEKGNKTIELCPHIFTNNHWGVVDACDAPRWQPYDPERAKSWSPIPPVDYLHQLAEEFAPPAAYEDESSDDIRETAEKL